MKRRHVSSLPSEEQQAAALVRSCRKPADVQFSWLASLAHP